MKELSFIEQAEAITCSGHLTTAQLKLRRITS